MAQVFSCEFCEVSKNTFFTEHLWVSASVILLLRFSSSIQLEEASRKKSCRFEGFVLEMPCTTFWRCEKKRNL